MAVGPKMTVYMFGLAYVPPLDHDRFSSNKHVDSSLNVMSTFDTVMHSSSHIWHKQRDIFIVKENTEVSTNTVITMKKTLWLNLHNTKNNMLIAAELCV